MEHIYFVVEEPFTGWVKIGFSRGNYEAGVSRKAPRTTGIEQRLADLQVGNPRVLVLHAMLPATRAQERRVHELLANKRGVGEWFLLPDFLEVATAQWLTELVAEARRTSDRRIAH